jgi:excinuclease ABC subunit C
MNDKLRQILKTAPDAPGVYMFKHANGAVIYVGKAKSIKNRMKSYLNPDDADGPKLRVLVANISDVEFVRTSTEFEALVLESSLIKKYKPRYNILLKDDKTFPYIKINKKLEWPRVQIVRRVTDDGAMYFGPYTSSRFLNNIIATINMVFPFRKCADGVFRSAKRPCINYEIKQCLAPCCGLIGKKEYDGVIDGVVSVLKGKIKDVIETLEKEMLLASDNLEFEFASQLLDRINSLKILRDSQSVVLSSKKDIDVISVSKDGDNFAFNILLVRDGMLLGQSNILIKGPYEEEEALRRLLIDHYIKNIIPSTIVVPIELKDASIVEFLSSNYKGKDKLVVTHKSLKDIRGLRSIGLKNLEDKLKSVSLKQERSNVVMGFLSKALSVDGKLSTIECYDMSNISGKYAVGVKVVFEEGSPKKSLYRKYKIRGDFKGDDLKMMKEVMQRRLKHLDSEPLSDVILIDGGRTQLNAVNEVFNLFPNSTPTIISIAKDKTKSKGLSVDKIYFLNDKKFIELDLSPEHLNFLKMIRDETHRFAISYHRNLRGRAALKL